MNPEPPLTIPAVAPRQRRFLILQLGVAAICVLIASALLVTPSARPPVGSVMWLTTAERNRLTHPGPITRLKWKLMNWTAPLLHRLWSAKPGVQIETHLLTLPANATEIGLPAPIATNSDGARAWILSPSDFKALRERTKNLPGVSMVVSPSLTTSDESQAQVSMLNNTSIAGKSASVGVTVDVAPKITGDSVRLLVSALSTEPLGAAGNTPSRIRTNFAVNYQAWISNRCAMIVDGGPAHDAKSNAYWFILVPTIVDSKGNPRK